MMNCTDEHELKIEWNSNTNVAVYCLNCPHSLPIEDAESMLNENAKLKAKNKRLMDLLTGNIGKRDEFCLLCELHPTSHASDCPLVDALKESK